MIEVGIHHVGGLAKFGAGREIGLVDFAPVCHISLGEVGADEVFNQLDVIVIKTLCVAHLDLADGIGRNLEGTGKRLASVMMASGGDDLK